MSGSAKKMATNTIWNAVENFSQLGIQMLCTFVLARFLTPSDFGLLGMLVVFTQISKTIIDSGFGAALIRENNVSENDYCSVFWLNLSISVFIYIILYFSSGGIASFYRQPILLDMCKVTFLVIPLYGFQVVQRAIFVRELKFKLLGLISFAAALLSSIVAIILAYFWRNVWALVLQNLMMGLFTTLLLWIFSDWRPRFKFSLLSIHKYWTFSKNLLLTGLLGNIFNNLNSLLIGRFYTSSDLGYYSQANRINMIASSQTTNVIKNVSFPILSQVNNSGGDLKSGYSSVIKVTFLFVGCIMALIIGVAPDMFEILMGGEEWRMAGKYLIILGFAGMLHPLHSINENILRVTGSSSTLLKLEMTRRCINLFIIFITVHYSVTVFVLGYSVYSLLLLFLNMIVCGKPINYHLQEQIKDILPLLIKQLLVCAVGLFAAYILSGLNLYVRFPICLILETAICFMLFRNDATFIQVKHLLRSIISKK